MYHCTVKCFLFLKQSNINHVAWVVNNFLTIVYIYILVAAKLNHPRKLQETHVQVNPYKAPIALLCEVYRFCCCCPTYIFSVDLPMLVEDLGKFQKHCCLRASRMDCNVCFIVKLQLVKVSRQTSTCQRRLSSNFNLSKKFRTFDFCQWILSLQIYNFTSVSQTQIRENVDKLNKAESYILTDNYSQLSVQ